MRSSTTKHTDTAVRQSVVALVRPMCSPQTIRGYSWQIDFGAGSNADTSIATKLHANWLEEASP